MRQVHGLSKDGTTITLKRLQSPWQSFNADSQSDNRATALYLDTETTGTDGNNDKIIDLGYIIFDYDKQSGRILEIRTMFSQLEDPEEPLSEPVKSLTGYQDSDLVGKKIDWHQVTKDFESVSLIIAHNAQFDRAFLDRYVPLSQQKVWACSLHQIAWRQKGHGSASLEYLCKDHGFFFEGHTALADVEAALYLISLNDQNGSAYLKELLMHARQRMKWVHANGAAFDFKDTLRQRGYRWDKDNRVWKIKVLEQSKEEEDFIAAHNEAGVAQCIGIALHENFRV